MSRRGAPIHVHEMERAAGERRVRFFWIESFLITEDYFPFISLGQMRNQALSILRQLGILQRFFYRFLVVNWGVALLAVLLGVTFAVIVGLLVGVISDNPTSVGMWGAILIISLFGVTMVGVFVDLNWHPLIQTLLDYLPTAAMAELLGFSMAGEFPVAQMWANAGALLVASLAAFGLLTWRLRLTDR